MSNPKPLRQTGEYQTPDGATLLLCVACETDSEISSSYPAIVIFQGFSLCREHMEEWHKFGIHNISSTN